MAYEFKLPEIGEGVVEGEIVSWKVKPGDTVAVNEPLCEVMTDKATVEISSPKAGTIAKVFGAPGDVIKVHTPLVLIDESGASAPVAAAPVAAPAPARTPAPAAPPAPAPSPHRAAPAANFAAAPVAARGETRAAPAVRRHAREEGVDLSTVAGSGPNGRITHADVAASLQPATAAPEPRMPPALPQVQPSGSETRVKIIGLRRKISEQMTKSRHTAAHFTYVEEVDCTRLVALRDRLKGRAEARGVKLTYLPIIAKACSVVFREFPNINAVMDEAAGELVVKGDHHIGFATDTPQGLFVPVIRNVEQKSILHIAAELAELADRTRKGKATPKELSGSTFTITGVGAIGGVLATPILNIPEVAILGTNAIRDAAVVRNGQIVIRKMMYLSPSFDHRIIDGAVGARFTAALKAILEDPDALLLDLA
jgi:pyruvate dehydrogenase E2 component (dihydrolipoamide acetyltransferase)